MQNNEDFEIDLDKLEMINVERSEVLGPPVEAEPDYVRNPAYARQVLETVLAKYPHRFSNLSSNQFAIVQKFNKKPRSAVKKLELLKGGKRLFFLDAPECKDAYFYLEVDKTKFNELDESDQETVLYRQLCKIFYDMEKEKYVLLGPDVEIYLSMVQDFGKGLDEVIDVQKALSLADDKDDEDE